jgi:tetratricopeptide (TPR) repeat protein/serine/threonine protein kinase
MAAMQRNEQAIFEVARQIDAREARETYLQQICGGDAALGQRIRALLRAYEERPSFLETPAARLVVTMDEPIREGLGTVIGPYKLLQEIGEGGMGTVFMAEQTHPVQRKVALKVIKPGMDSRQVVARFEAERQALAMMDHVNIARVLDAGATETGRPFFVMELVHGVPITKYCDDNCLTPRERLELFVPVCQALQHAHQKGIIHRDIKPSNVMITLYDGKPVPKVIDFGVAKATEQKLTERTLFTQYGTMVGTFEYMSPEQAEMSALGVDTRSDIYSLGVLLYELLTGSTPLTHKRLKEAAYAEILRMIKEEEPPKPSTRLCDSGETLVSISAQRRMEPAKLTKVVRGELDWIVMKTLEKDRNRRYETASAFAADVQRYLNDETVWACPPSLGYRFRKFARRNKAALAFTGLVLLILLTVTGGIGWNVRDRAARQTAVEYEVSLAVREAEQWEKQAKWPEALSAAKRAQGLLAGGGSDDLREHVHQLRKDLEMVLRLEDIRLLSSEWKNDKFDLETADRAYAQAFADFGINVAGLPADEAAARIRERAGVAVALAAALDDWTILRAFSGRRKEKVDSLALAALAQAADPNPWRRQLREAVQQKDTKALAALAASPESLHQPPTSLLTLARAMRAWGDLDSATQVWRRAQRQYPGDFWINFDLANTLDKRGPAHRDEVVAFRRAALAVRPKSTAAHNNLGHALYSQGKLDEAIACFRRAIEFDPTFLKAHWNLGAALSEQRKLDEAIACYRTAIDLGPKVAALHCDLGKALKAQKKADEAIACYRTALKLDPTFVKAHVGLGGALADRERLDEAVAAFRKAIALDAKSALAHTNLGIVLKAQGKADEAIRCYRTAIKLDPKSALAHRGLGLALGSQGKLEEAIACFRTAIELDPKSAAAPTNLGTILYLHKKWAEATAAFRKAIQLDPKSAHAHIGLGAALAAQHKLEEASAAFRQAIKLDPKLAAAHNGLGVALVEQKKLDEAIRSYRKAIDLDPKNAIAHNNLGNALRAKGLQDDAITAYGEAIRLQPKLAVAHYHLGLALKDQGKLDQAIESFERAIALEPNHAFRHNELAWLLATWAEAKFRDPKRAVALAKKAVQLEPKNGIYWQTLGYAEYRAGSWKSALAALEKVKALGSAGGSPEWFPLAMAHWQLGHKEEARSWYDQAVQWMDKNQPKNEELRRFRAEAAELLGIEKKKH